MGEEKKSFRERLDEMPPDKRRELYYAILNREDIKPIVEELFGGKVLALEGEIAKLREQLEAGTPPVPVDPGKPMAPADPFANLFED